MPVRTSLETPRLLLRRFGLGDLAPFAALNADPEVMACFPSTLSRRASDELAERIEAGFSTHGFGLWALEVKATGSFIGFTGLAIPGFDAAFTPAVEIGWRLARSAWSSGFATEAARASLRHGFGKLGLAEVVSFTFEGNRRSRAVMERLGMVRDPADDFDHPGLAGHPLAPHVLYRLGAERWFAANG